MKKYITIAILTIQFTTFACSVALSQKTQEVRLGN
jgi:hypothetical protein